MKRKDLKSLREKERQDLMKILDEDKRGLNKIFLNLGAQKEKNLKAGKLLKRDIAQILTIIREKELSEK
ncbi:50S ribosomal protein L29 [Candidatus Woesebacteria bacterium]|nr:50S ribosomal protein L29 [Candidatus Woesebacteria bacterium]